MTTIMRVIPLALAVLCGVSGLARAHERHDARHHHHYWRAHHFAYHRHRHHHLAFGRRRHARHAARSEFHRAGIIHEETAAGPITVAADAAQRFKALIAALVMRGFHGSVTCYAARGHIPDSLHHSGHACDFAQTAKNRTVPIMYHSSALIRRFGLRDGCSFGDCGHVDTGRTIVGRARHRYVHARNEHRQIRRYDHVADANWRHDVYRRHDAYWRRRERIAETERFTGEHSSRRLYLLADSGRRRLRRVAGLPYMRDRQTPH